MNERIDQKMKIHQMTMVEVLVSMGIFSIIMLIVANVVFAVTRVDRKERQQADLYRDQRLLMNVIMQDLQGFFVDNETDKEVFCNFGYKNNSGVGGASATFISNCNLGIMLTSDTSYDKSFTQEIAYVFDSATHSLYRYYSLKKDPEWDFHDKSVGSGTYAVADWGGDASSFADSALMADNVREFSITAYWANDIDSEESTANEISGSTGVAANGDTCITPYVVVVRVALIDKGDSDNDVKTGTEARRVFTKRIFINQR